MADRKRLSFSQREGLEPIPGPLELGELSRECRNALWSLLYQLIERAVTSQFSATIGGSWRRILQDKHVHFDQNPVDTFSDYDWSVYSQLKKVIFDASYNKVFDLIEFVLNHPVCPDGLAKRVDGILVEMRAAYRVAPADKTIVPAVTPEQGEALLKAISDTSSNPFAGAHAHLVKASRALNNGEFATCVRESIHAVEAVARKIDPKGSKTLDPALDQLASHIRIHPALKQAFSKLYGYTSDEKGVRHALLDDNEAKVDLHDAVFMLGACASFVSYLIGKLHKAEMSILD